MKTKGWFAPVLVAGLLLVQLALAKGPPQKVTISGAGLQPQIELTGDQAVLNALGLMTLEDYHTVTTTAPDGISGDGYLITRYYETERHEYVAFDQLRYYPDPAGGRGYLYYIGIVNGWSEYDSHWFRANPASEAVLRDLIANAQQTQVAMRGWFAQVVPQLIALLKTSP